jgi:F-type H+-transporting ATPase subunit epsilon
MHPFQFTILTPDKKIFNDKVLSAVLPTREGEITILAGHAPLVSVMAIGEVKVKLENGEEKGFHLQGGVLKVGENGKEAVLLSDTEVDATRIEELDLQKEIDRAKEAMQGDVDEGAFATFEGELERYLYLDKILKRRK